HEEVRQELCPIAIFASPRFHEAAISKRENDSLLRCAGWLVGGQLTGSSGSRRGFNAANASDRFGGSQWANGFAGRSRKSDTVHPDAGGVAGADNVGVGPRSRCLRLGQ